MICYTHAGVCCSSSFRVCYVNKVFDFSISKNQCILNMCGSTSTYFYGIIHFLSARISCDGHVLDGKIRLSLVIRTFPVKVSVSFYPTWVFFCAGKSFFPYSVAVTQSTFITLCKVEHIIIAVYSKNIFYIYCTSKKFNGIICAFCDVNIFNGSTFSDSIQCQTIMFDVCIGTSTSVQQLYIF